MRTYEIGNRKELSRSECGHQIKAGRAGKGWGCSVHLNADCREGWSLSHAETLEEHRISKETNFSTAARILPVGTPCLSEFVPLNGRRAVRFPQVLARGAGDFKLFYCHFKWG